PEPSCSDGELNNAETDIDCGGGICPKCIDNKGCVAAADCISNLCDNGICVPEPGCSDGVLNGTETGIDCGGVCPKCSEDQPCLVDSDCDSGWCLNSQCVPQVDSDGDGIPDFKDIDDDNDGILDSTEFGGINSSGDSDGDHVPDWQDADSSDCPDTNDDGICDSLSANIDFDGDGIPNHLDLDADGDGIADLIEGGGNDTDGDGVLDDITDSDGDGLADLVDTDNDGTPLPVPDTDNDGAPDFLDLDSDGDGLSDVTEGGGVDADSDGLLDDDLDGDGDGLADSVDGNDGGEPLPLPDTDEDGVPDYQDWDDDGDGISTATEIADSAVLGDEVDDDGIPAWHDTDADGDGVSDADEGTGDDDKDGIPNYLDPLINDDDNDGLSNEDEVGYGTDPTNPDSDDDGLLDGAEVMDHGTNPLNPDTDGGGVSDGVEVDAGTDPLDANDGDGYWLASGGPSCSTGSRTQSGTESLMILSFLLGLLAIRKFRAVPGRWVGIWLLLTVATFLPRQSAAQVVSAAGTTSVALDSFDPLHSQRTNILSIHGSQLLEHLTVAGTLWYQHANDLAVLRRNGKDRAGVFVGSSNRMDLALGLGLYKYAEVGITLPLQLYQNGDDLEFLGRPGDTVSGFSVGDIQTIFKFVFLQPREFKGFGLGLSTSLYLPVGDTDTFQSDGSIRVLPQLIIDWRNNNNWHVALNAGAMFRSERQVHNAVFSHSIKLGLALAIPTPWKPLQILALAQGALPTTPSKDPTDVTLATEGELLDTAVAEAQLGARIEVMPNWLVTTTGGAGFTNGFGTPDWRLVLGIGYQPETAPIILDADHDGLMDDKDKCPLEPEDKDGFQDADGCPDLDNDQDGIPDKTDGKLQANGFGACMNSPEDKDQWQDEDGCPDLDNDNDGIPDTRDGVVGKSGYGYCLNAPEDKDQWQDEDGCPDPDNDKDGIPDVRDKCPNKPEVYNGLEDTDGCPDKNKVIMKGDQIVVLDKIYFKSARAVIKKNSYDVVNSVAQVLKAYPGIKLVEVQGHTDKRGSARRNKQLSQRRAQAVVKHLAGQGIDKSRLRAVGYGESKLLLPNARSPKEHARNRRVQFVIVENSAAIKVKEGNKARPQTTD
ncbi:MAG TPA: hypothetical protein EYN06_08745, partial [Myxococcales bacterium]|nr:hypothetical protein [Myxococcales bacterium]